MLEEQRRTIKSTKRGRTTASQNPGEASVFPRCKVNDNGKTRRTNTKLIWTYILLMPTTWHVHTIHMQRLHKCRKQISAKLRTADIFTFCTIISELKSKDNKRQQNHTVYWIVGCEQLQPGSPVRCKSKANEAEERTAQTQIIILKKDPKRREELKHLQTGLSPEEDLCESWSILECEDVRDGTRKKECFWRRWFDLILLYALPVARNTLYSSSESRTSSHLRYSLTVCQPHSLLSALLATIGTSTFLQGGLGSRTISILTRMISLQIYLEPRALTTSLFDSLFNRKVVFFWKTLKELLSLDSAMSPYRLSDKWLMDEATADLISSRTSLNRLQQHNRGKHPTKAEVVYSVS